MDPHHGEAHPFTRSAHGRFGILTRPLVTVRLRRSAAHRWSGSFEALVDTGASITLVHMEVLEDIPEFDAAMLGPELPWSTATHGAETCRPVALDLLLGRFPDKRPLELLQTSLYATPRQLVAPILLGQRGVLDRLGLVHRNVGPRPYFRFLR